MSKKKLRARIEQLEATVARQEERITELEAREPIRIAPFAPTVPEPPISPPWIAPYIPPWTITWGTYQSSNGTETGN